MVLKYTKSGKIWCLDECKYFNDSNMYLGIRIGSVKCQQCDYFVKIISDNEIECNHEETKQTENQPMVTKKADIYFDGEIEEVRVCVKFEPNTTLSQSFKIICDAVEKHSSPNVRIKSIYFSEEKTK